MPGRHLGRVVHSFFSPVLSSAMRARARRVLRLRCAAIPAARFASSFSECPARFCTQRPLDVTGGLLYVIENCLTGTVLTVAFFVLQKYLHPKNVT